jgi:ABC-2 type transport system ATP-binding protein
VLACDKPATLKRRLQAEAIYRMEVSPLNGLGVERFESLPGVRNVALNTQDGFNILEFILAQDDVLGSVVNTMTTEGIHILNLQKREPTLEDVFVDLVGRSMEEVEKGG